jgi:hypothetical protein
MFRRVPHRYPEIVCLNLQGAMRHAGFKDVKHCNLAGVKPRTKESDLMTAL